MSSTPQRSVTVFVHRERGSFIARTSAADALHPSSASIAARRCAAQHFGVDECEVEVLPADDHAEHVMIAVLHEPGRAVVWAVILVVVGWGVGLAAAIAGIFFIVGGAS